MTPARDISRLIEIMAALRTPKTGCPWDLEQDFATIAPYTIEEAYEVADAIARGDLTDLREELGDLLLQVVFHARMAQEQGAFDFGGCVVVLGWIVELGFDFVGFLADLGEHRARVVPVEADLAGFLLELERAR